ncbi:uncharacterized protein BDR25DRAFT_359628 [Lindgomyces ingoldianus]|uniref:Uncharacterized protein n=1 Tax=Lindgomyces ingoldianus TaxID=673940 RepID=A0ACB6QH98_9PLEO|nr:uncharacterized protein BDR25DRAFT_359628 [Lindgomyces ingoldianus]KAF2466260.1 hypothetical protein BDR25DRAFT_359628 [Lindgomyces ingoldianus]
MTFDYHNATIGYRLSVADLALAEIPQLPASPRRGGNEQIDITKCAGAAIENGISTLASGGVAQWWMTIVVQVQHECMADASEPISDASREMNSTCCNIPIRHGSTDRRSGFSSIYVSKFQPVGWNWLYCVTLVEQSLTVRGRNIFISLRNEFHVAVKVWKLRRHLKDVGGIFGIKLSLPNFPSLYPSIYALGSSNPFCYKIPTQPTAFYNRLRQGEASIAVTAVANLIFMVSVSIIGYSTYVYICRSRSPLAKILKVHWVHDRCDLIEPTKSRAGTGAFGIWGAKPVHIRGYFAPFREKERSFEDLLPKHAETRESLGILGAMLSVAMDIATAFLFGFTAIFKAAPHTHSFPRKKLGIRITPKSLASIRAKEYIVYEQLFASPILRDVEISRNENTAIAPKMKDSTRNKTECCGAVVGHETSGMNSDPCSLDALQTRNGWMSPCLTNFPYSMPTSRKAQTCLMPERGNIQLGSYTHIPGGVRALLGPVASTRIQKYIRDRIRSYLIGGGHSVVEVRFALGPISLCTASGLYTVSTTRPANHGVFTTSEPATLVIPWAGVPGADGSRKLWKLGSCGGELSQLAQPIGERRGEAPTGAEPLIPLLVNINPC